MSLGDDVRQFIPDWREAAESLMVDTATVWRDGPMTLDPATGIVSSTPVAIHAGARCRIRPATSEDREHQFGEQQVTTSRHIACLPHDVTGIKLHDVIEITASGDADMLGARFRVQATPVMTYVLYRGFPVEILE